MLCKEVMMPLDLILGSDGEEVGRASTLGVDFKDGWVEAHQQAREILEGVQRRTIIYKVGDVVMKNNDAGVLCSSK